MAYSLKHVELFIKRPCHLLILHECRVQFYTVNFIRKALSVCFPHAAEGRAQSKMNTRVTYLDSRLTSLGGAVGVLLAWRFLLGGSCFYSNYGILKNCVGTPPGSNKGLPPPLCRLVQLLRPQCVELKVLGDVPFVKVKLTHSGVAACQHEGSLIAMGLSECRTMAVSFCRACTPYCGPSPAQNSGSAFVA